MEDDTIFLNEEDIKIAKTHAQLRARGDKVLAEHQIPVNEFYNYYSVPWDDSLYVKFPVTKLVISHRENKISFGSSFDDDDDTSEAAKKRSHFMGENYLGSARETDTERLKFFLNGRKELVY